MTNRKCKECPHAQFGSFGKYGQEHYCDVDDHDITTEIIYNKTYICPLDDKENKDE